MWVYFNRCNIIEKVMTFILGQRWISDSESDAGLGIIVEVNNRSVTLFFPAINENRVYSNQAAPITRVLFDVGDIITSVEGWKIKVDTLVEENGIIRYSGHSVESDESLLRSLSELQIDSNLNYSKPQLRLFAGQIDRADRFAMRYNILRILSQQYQMPWSGLRGSRTRLIPHQLYIAQEVAKRHNPRVLLADEVGLGKTIEAGLIIHKRLLSGLSSRILIVVPESLQYQWIVEMLRRFNLRFSLFDQARYEDEKISSNNPFEMEQCIICSLDFIEHNAVILDQIKEANFDLLIVDEAHHLVWSEEQPSDAYLAIESLTQTIPAVLLLTATPEQLGMESHFARLRLLDPARFHDYPSYLKEQKHYQSTAQIINQLLDDATLQSESLAQLNALLPESETATLLDNVNSKEELRHPAREKIIRILMDLHGTGRLLFRNTRHHIQGFPKRQLRTFSLTVPEALLLSFDQYQWREDDPRAVWLLNYLQNHRDKKIVLICHTKQVAIQLAEYVKRKDAVSYALFHEDLSILERDRAAAYFATPESGAQVLICSEIGSEGRNFQYVDTLVMYDLPHNPDLLEQRIGRLDRIGQMHDIQLLVPFVEQSEQAVLLRWFHEGLNAFEKNCAIGKALYDQYKDQLAYFSENPQAVGEFDVFLSECRQAQEALMQELEEGRDRLLEIYSSGGDVAKSLTADLAKQDHDPKFVMFATQMFDIIGLDQNDLDNGSVHIIPNKEQLISHFPGINEEGCLITFDREQALALEDAQFMTWEHPYILNSMDLILSENIGKTAVSFLKNKALPLGMMLLEMIYIVESKAPKSLELTRFLPPSPLRLLMDMKGSNLAEQVDFDTFNGKLSFTNRNTAKDVVKVLQNQISQMIAQGEKVIPVQAEKLIQSAKLSADEILSEELSRLKTLKLTNPLIRQEEIDAHANKRDAVLSAIGQANWRLDALRLIVVTHD